MINKILIFKPNKCDARNISYEQKYKNLWQNFSQSTLAICRKGKYVMPKCVLYTECNNLDSMVFGSRKDSYISGAQQSRNRHSYVQSIKFSSFQK